MKVCFMLTLNVLKLSQRTIKPTIRLARPVRTLISLRTRAVWSESLLIAWAFYNLRAIQREINENPCHTVWVYRLIWVFAGHKGHRKCCRALAQVLCHRMAVFRDCSINRYLHIYFSSQVSSTPYNFLFIRYCLFCISINRSVYRALGVTAVGRYHCLS